MKIFILNIVIALWSFQVYAQSKSYKWSDDACSYEGTYNPSAVNEDQLKNTFKLGLSDYFNIQTVVLLVKNTGTNNHNLASLNKEYLLKKKELTNLKIVRTAYWVSFKNNKLMELNQIYTIKKYILSGYQNPRLLNQLKLGSDCKKKYLTALITGGGVLLNSWKEVHVEQTKKNAAPERLESEYKAQYNSPDKYKYARIAVMNFGLSNCLNQYIHYVNNDANNINFKKLFSKVKTAGCDTPD